MNMLPAIKATHDRAYECAIEVVRKLEEEKNLILEKLKKEEKKRLETSKHLRAALEFNEDSKADKEPAQCEKCNQLQIELSNKDKELSKNMAVISELRCEKDLLNETIQRLQNKIDNFEKGLTYPGQLQQTINMDNEQDDNAVMLTSPKRAYENRAFGGPRSPIIELRGLSGLHPRPPTPIPGGPKVGDNKTNEKELVKPPPPKMDSRDTMFNFFSDNSAECETLETNEKELVKPPPPKMDCRDIISDNSTECETLENYRSRAYGNGRGKCRSPMPASGAHRRRPLTPAVQGGLRHKTNAKNEDLMAPSEAKATMQAKPRLFFKTKRQDKKISSKNVF